MMEGEEQKIITRFISSSLIPRELKVMLTELQENRVTQREFQEFMAYYMLENSLNDYRHRPHPSLSKKAIMYMEKGEKFKGANIPADTEKEISRYRWQKEMISAENDSDKYWLRWMIRIFRARNDMAAVNRAEMRLNEILSTEVLG